jgi:hypothetical protein
MVNKSLETKPFKKNKKIEKKDREIISPDCSTRCCWMFCFKNERIKKTEDSTDEWNDWRWRFCQRGTIIAKVQAHIEQLRQLFQLCVCFLRNFLWKK